MKRIKNFQILFLFLLASLLSFESKAQQEQEPEQDLQETEQGMKPAVKEDFTDQELQQFIEANKVAIGVQQSAEQKMISAIEKEGLDIQTFNEILTSKQNPEAETQATPEDQGKFNTAVEEVVKIQEEMMTEMESAIQETGISVEQYEEILLAYQQSPVVQEKLNQLLNNSMEQE